MISFISTIMKGTNCPLIRVIAPSLSRQSRSDKSNQPKIMERGLQLRGYN